MKRHTRILGFVLLLAGTFVLGGFLIPAAGKMSGPRLFQEVFTLVAGRYVDSLDVSALYEKAARGLIDELSDPYAALYSPEEVEEFTVAHEGKYGGIGMMVENQEGAAVVARVFPNTPSERAGLRVGDRIVAVDGEVVEGWPLEKITGRLKGEPGTDVEVKVARRGAAGPVVLRMTRAEIHIPAVPYATILEGGAGYIPLLQFSETAAEEVEEQVRRLVAEGATGLVLDLRGNGGGIVEDAIAIAGLFLPEGTPVARQWERSAGDLVYRSTEPPLVPDLPLVVLIDEWSASASEIVAGALQDHDRAIVIGEPSFGKGLIQSAYRLDGGYILKFTTGKWFTPSGRTIHRDRELVNGRLVEVADTLDADTSLASRPVFRSASGRKLYGGGGIVPDVIVRPDTLTSAEQAFVKAILPRSHDVHLTLFDYAFELKSQVEPGFRVMPAWRDELYRRLLARGVKVDRAVYDAAASYVDGMIEERVARMAFGDAEARRRTIHGDTPLLRALELLDGRRTQAELIASVGAAATGP